MWDAIRRALSTLSPYTYGSVIGIGVAKSKSIDPAGNAGDRSGESTSGKGVGMEKRSMTVRPGIDPGSVEARDAEAVPKGKALRLPESVPLFGDLLAGWRTDAGFSQRSLAKKLGISNAQLSRIENGLQEAPSSRANPEFHIVLRELMPAAIYQLVMAAYDAPLVREAHLAVPHLDRSSNQTQDNSGLAIIESVSIPVPSGPGFFVVGYVADTGTNGQTAPMSRIREALQEIGQDAAYHARQIGRAVN
jgi:hypothetical protein